MIRRLASLLAGVAVVLAAAGAAAEPATLIADRVALERDGALVAEGDVEVFYGETRLRAQRIRYDRARDSLAFEGPLQLDEGEGFVMIADAAELSRDLREGVLEGARLVLGRQLQLAADTVARGEGRYTRLERSVASSCRVCPDSPTPLWEIRAREVVHDQLEQQIHFDRAQFRVFGVPIVYLPRLRVPAPGNVRTSGFLVPRLRATSDLGPGLRMPYFVELADDRDLTLTPYLAQGRTATMELRYRQAFRRGDVEISGGLSRDSIRPDAVRGFVLGEGRFAVGAQTALDLRLEAASDRTYLDDYGHTSRDLLTSGATLERITRDDARRAEALVFRSLRSDAVNPERANRVARGRWTRRFEMPGLGGVMRTRLDALALHRAARSDVTGRDMARARAAADWRRDWILPGGIEAGLAGELVADHYAIRRDSRFARHVARVTPQAALELRWPWHRTESSGAVQVIEPVAQLVWARPTAPAVPNEDSRIVEFDEGNLFALDRAPGADNRELGRRASLGISWTRISPGGWSAALAIGRVYRAGDGAQFTDLSGLSGRRSDWLAAMRIDNGAGLSITNRALFDSDLSITKAESRVGWRTSRLELATSLATIAEEPAENRPRGSSEWSFDAGYAFTDALSARVDWRYDLASGEAQRGGIGMELRNECALVDVSLSRRFATSTRVEPSTNFGLSVELLGFGGASPGASGGCGT